MAAMTSPHFPTFSTSPISPPNDLIFNTKLKFIPPPNYNLNHQTRRSRWSHRDSYRVFPSDDSRVELIEDGKEQSRPIKSYNETYWGNFFKSSTPSEKQEMLIEHQLLVKKVENELLSTSHKPLECLKLIDAIERLGVAYHFNDQIEEALTEIYNNIIVHEDHENEEDIYHTCLQFRLLRQHGFYVTSDSFIKFTDGHGKFLESLAANTHGILSLYEASHLRVYGEDVLEEALSFTSCHLKAMKSSSGCPLLEEINHALSRPNQRSLVRLEARHHIDLYGHDPSHSEDLLKFVKIDFNVLQSLYKKELQEITRWWEGLCYADNFPFARDRLVENYFLGMMLLFEPKHSLSRIIFSKASVWMTVLDDLYDSYGTSVELKVFTEVIQRWDKSYMHQLPDYMKVVYEMMLDDFDAFENDLIEARKPNFISYGIEEVKCFSRACLRAVKCRQAKNATSYDEYVRHGMIAMGAKLMASIAMMTMGREVEKEDFECLSLFPNIARDTSKIARLLNDIAGYETDKNEGGVSSLLCYMKQYSMSKEETCAELTRQIEGAWIDANEEICLYPKTRMRKLLNTILLRIAQYSNAVYDGEDGFRMVKNLMKKYITLTLVEPITL